ncbi:helix-turn-helix domain-containing protein [Methylobacterium sp. R2-1]|uniref:helix-turn-helix domain-containing protein n=1 Tax=Methylobacterium sp. R2-1 TaxID=2587064 RepID=UPI00160A8878|nr:helix-turn-helix transcriptional regulator [Methylobacterium sp. R2-1]MBB2959888.1 transcriptional regulator with XRE-family HTH domain [Methylobacterium sp. R2-1]
MSATPPAERPPIEFSARLPTDADRAIGTRIAACRKAAGISQNALAQALGVSYPQLQKYETGANRVSAGRLHKIAQQLGTTIGALVGEEGASPVDGETLALLAEPGAVEHLRAFVALKDEHRSLVAWLARDLRGAQAEAA